MNEVGEEGLTPLLLAVYKYLPKTVEVLMENGAGE